MVNKIRLQTPVNNPTLRQTLANSPTLQQIQVNSPTQRQIQAKIPTLHKIQVKIPTKVCNKIFQKNLTNNQVEILFYLSLLYTNY